MQRYFGKNVENNKIMLSNDDKFHIKTVMRLKESDSIEVVYDNKVYISKLTDDYNAIIDKEIENDSENKVKRVLIIPLLKEQKMDLILQKGTELGVDEIIPVIMERSIININGKEEKKLERWAKILKEASEQSKRTMIPAITKPKKLFELKELDGLKMVCSTVEKEMTLKKFLTQSKNYDTINIVMGPEGGISSKEEELLNSVGFTSITLGNRILRVETVPMYVLSVLNYENME